VSEVRSKAMKKGGRAELTAESAEIAERDDDALRAMGQRQKGAENMRIILALYLFGALLLWGGRGDGVEGAERDGRGKKKKGA